MSSKPTRSRIQSHIIDDEYPSRRIGRGTHKNVASKPYGVDAASAAALTARAVSAASHKESSGGGESTVQPSNDGERNGDQYSLNQIRRHLPLWRLPSVRKENDPAKEMVSKMLAPPPKPSSSKKQAKKIGKWVSNAWTTASSTATSAISYATSMLEESTMGLNEDGEVPGVVECKYGGMHYHPPEVVRMQQAKSSGTHTPPTKRSADSHRSCRDESDRDRVRSLQELTRRLEISDSVQFVFNQPYPVLQKWLSKATIDK